MTPKQFENALPMVCSRETSSDPKGWSSDNPLYGHCAVASLVAQNLFGGTLMRVSLEGTPFETMRSHYFNVLPDGTAQDFTAPQFCGRFETGLGSAQERTRAHLLQDPITRARYRELAWHLARHVSGNPPIFESSIYKECFGQAIRSPCRKMKFGCVIKTKDGKTLSAPNTTILGLASLCENACVRENITSRTEQMLGACGHAEEAALWKAVDSMFSLCDAAVYVAGLYSNCLPWFKTEAEHTCLRCAVQMQYAKVATVYVPVHGQWQALSAANALQTALTYARQQKQL